ncbi:MAG TPA: recombinase family protein [Terriglobales bacterium]|nr:recombinase family protein [Terriglobales bacterium]
MAEARKQSRCAIYTRKSTEHNLDLEFNSLDAQREACEAYIKSQAHEGWRLVPGDFNDGGISGASLDRPALQALISEIAAGKIDVVVVYKVDRLTRSLTDFAKLVDLFDKHGVSFVSITQSFNTTTSMGRLTLNVLLSFAQFEREVIGERVRDKIAASKRKGLWMGGPVPLGYASVNKKLVIVEDEAETVRTIFKRYLELGSMQALATDLDSQGMRTKERAWSNDRTVGGGRFGTGPLAYLLKNRAYVGEVVHQNQIFQGDHAPIVDRELFDAVQEKLKGGAVERKLRLKGSPSLLAGKIYDDRGNRMTPSHTLKKGVRYRYYVSQALLQNRDGAAGSVARVPAAEIETLVTDALRSLDRADDCSAQDGEWSPPQLARVVITSDAIKLHTAGQQDQTGGQQEIQVLTIPWTPRKLMAEKGVSGSQAGNNPTGIKNREAPLTAIARARVWVDDLIADRTTISDIAKREGKGERHIRLLLPLAFASPVVVETIAGGAAPRCLTITLLSQKMSNSWRAQNWIP